MNPPTKYQPTRHGGLMVLLSVVIIALAALAAVLIDQGITNEKGQITRKQDIDLELAVESASHAAKHWFQMNFNTLTAAGQPLRQLNNPQTVSFAAYPQLTRNLAGAVLTATIRMTWTATTANPDPATSVYRIDSLATVGDPTDPMNYRRLRMQVSLAPSPVNSFRQAMFSVNGFDFMGSAQTDSYTSAGNGIYDPDNPNNNGDLGSNGTIAVASPGEDANGNSVLDAGEDTNGNGVLDRGAVHGKWTSNMNLPLPEFHYQTELAKVTITTQLGAVIGSRTLTTAGSPYRASSVDLTGDNLTISGNVELWIDGDFILKNSSCLYSPTTSKLTIYQGPNATADFGVGNDTFGLVQAATGNDIQAIPEKLLFITETSSLVTLNGNGQLAAVIFAPNATFKMNGTFDFFGSVVANLFDTSQSGTTDMGKVNGNYSFHYDEALSALRLSFNPRLVVGAVTYERLGFHAQ